MELLNIKLLTLICMLFFLSDRSDYHEKNNKTQDFREFIKNIPTINLPLKITCQWKLEKSNLLRYSDSLNKKFGIVGDWVYGKIHYKKRFVAIISVIVIDIDVPIIQIFKNTGEKVDELTLLKYCYGDDTCFYSSSHAEITSDLKIKIIDTIKTCKLDTLDNVIQNSSKLKISNNVYVINSRGKFIKYN